MKKESWLWLGAASACLTITWGLYACSSSDDESVAVNSDGGAQGGDRDGASGASGGNGDDGGMNPTDAGPDGSSVYVFPDGGKGVHIEDPSGSYDLTNSPALARLGNGWAFGASSTAGGTLRSLSLTVRHLVIGDAGTSVAVEPVPGTYHCNDMLSPTPSQPSLSVVIQYATPSVTYQSNMVSNCEVTIDSFGAAGTSSTGTFAGRIAKVPNDIDAGVDVTGSFDLVRQN